MDVEAFRDISCLKKKPRVEYDAFRIEHEIGRYLELLDKYNIKCTLFVLCSALEHAKEFLLSAVKGGHEIALHGLTHEIPSSLDKDALKAQFTAGKKLLEDELGTEVVGYRAPCFAVTNEVIDALTELGFKYDSSYLDIKLSYTRSGADFGGYDRVCDGIYKKNGFYEIPPCKTKAFFGQMSVSGGGYIRLVPKTFLKRHVGKFIDTSDYYVFYCHPSDMFTESPPKLRGLSPKDRFFVEAGRKSFLSRTEDIIKMLIEKNYTFSTMRDFVMSEA